MQSWLITGATGFIGSVLARRLVERGDRVMALVRAGSNHAELSRIGVEPRIGNMLDRASLSAAMADAHAVVHLASLLKMPWKTAFVRDNVDGCANVAQAAAEQPTAPVLVLVSSMAAAGPSPPARARDETDTPQPVSLYGRVKLAGEQAAIRHAAQLPLSIVRPPMVFGPGDRPTLPLFKAAYRGLSMAPPHAGPIPMIQVGDLADMLIATAERGERLTVAGPHGEGIYQVAHAEQPASDELGGLLAQALGRPPPRVINVPRAALTLAAGASELWGRLRDRPAALNLDKVHELTGGSWLVSTDKMTDELGFRPAALAQRLLETARWYLDQGWIS